MDEINNGIEQYLHIVELKAEIQELSDGAMVMGMGENSDQGLQEAFLESILAYERAEHVPLRTLLERDGVMPPEPGVLSDEELSGKLNELIQAMGKRRHFLSSTDHLSDRDLYTHLVEVSLSETVPDLPNDDGNYYLDLTGGCSDENFEVYLKHYADDDCKAHWAESFPDMVIPPHEEPPYDRDRHLPKPPPPPNPYDDSQVAAEWCTECRTKLIAHLADEDVIHGDVGMEPVSYAPPVGSVWAVESKDCAGVVEWWALIGDCPSILASAKDIPSPRAFLQTISGQWRAEVDALNADRQRAEEQDESPDKPLLRVQPFYCRGWYARILDSWAADDSAWDDEWTQ